MLKDVYSVVTFQTVTSRPYSPEPPAEVHDQFLEPQCRQLGPPVLAPAWAEGLGSATHRHQEHRQKDWKHTLSISDGSQR